MKEAKPFGLRHDERLVGVQQYANPNPDCLMTYVEPCSKFQRKPQDGRTGSCDNCGHYGKCHR